MERLLAAIDRLTDAAAALAALLLAAVFLLGLGEIVMRAIFATTLGFALEYSGYLVASVLMLGSGRALRDGGHIRVALLLDRTGPHSSRTLDLAATAAGLLAAAALAYALVAYTIETALIGARSYFPTATPLWIPQAVMTLGPLSLALALFARLVRLLRGEEVAR